MAEFSSARQIENRNFLSKIKFRFTFEKAPKVAFYATKINIPSLTLGVVEQPTYLTNIPLPGEKIEFGDLNVDFLVDEDMKNYFEIQNWIRAIGFPESLKEIYDWQCSSNNSSVEGPYNSDMNLYSDGTLLVKTSNNNTNYQVVYRRMFPYFLSDLTFNSQEEDDNPHIASASFKYMMYNIRGKYGAFLPKDYDL